MKPLYCSFFTPIYVEESHALVQTMEQFGLTYHVERIPQFGDWLDIIKHKAQFLIHRRGRQPGIPLVWLDADARVRKYPDLFDSLDCDFAAHWRAGKELLGGTMYFGATQAADKLLSDWRGAMVGTPQLDQQDLQRLICDQGAPPEGLWVRPDGLRVYNLPASYAAIFDFDMCPESEWVISHHQASRRLKNKG